MTETNPNQSSKYDPTLIDAKWQKYWEEHQIFKADPNHKGEPYCIVIPPPNVTGSLHMGHAFEHSLIDTLVRYHRMKGRNTLWLPGTDHASIAVSTILDKQLKVKGKTREDVGREEYLETAWKWKEESGGTIVGQLRRLGLSVDWSRERFTMDQGLSKAVLEAFVQLYDDGLIYRGEYLVNWCPASQSAVSDLEVDNQEVNGNLWYFRYPLADGSGGVEVATTRPETMLGDTAVAVNPMDERYQHLIGKMLRLPIMGREIPIIADSLVDPGFGTGCVKVTPAHDPNDFEMGKRHDLPFINIMNKDGTLNQNAGEFQGQDRFVVRKNLVQRLEADGVLVKVEDYKHTVPYSDRGKVPVEPLLSTQWFVKIQPLADDTLAFLDEQNSPAFVPGRWTKVYRDWLVNLKDWCISRQLWWGHQIPAWYAVSETGGEITDSTPFVVARSQAEAQEQAAAQFGQEVKLKQDPDVLDTWFSSGLWPFSTMGWPDSTVDLKTYYPTTTLVTGFDIIFFWVARMTLMGGHFTGKMPFKDVYIHGLVLDEKGQKQSKSKNNGIDPLLLIDKYGTDALRYALIREVAGAGQNIRLEYDRKKDESVSVEASRNFANKLWNAARFVMMNLDGKTPQELGSPLDLLEQTKGGLELSDGVALASSLQASRWIISRFGQVALQTNEYLDNYGLGEAAKGLYEFIWGDFCDWYIEMVKSQLRSDAPPDSRRIAQQTLAYVLEGILKLLHPFMPHITEEIWQTLYRRSVSNDGVLMYADGNAEPQPKSESVLALQLYPGAIDSGVASKVMEIKEDLLISNSELQSSSTQVLEKGKGIWNQGVQFLSELPTNLGQLFRSYQKALIVVGWLFFAIIALKIAVSASSAINDLPIVSSTFELVGLGYTIWFVYRYLLASKNRQQLVVATQSFQEQIFGKERSEPLKVSISQDSLPISPILALGEQLPLPQKSGNAMIDLELEQQFELLIGTIRTIRNLRAEANVKPGVKVSAILQSESDIERQILQGGQSYIKDLAKVEALTITATLEQEFKTTMAGVFGTVQILMPLAGVVDLEALGTKLNKDLAKVEAEINSISGLLANQNFVNKAAPEKVQEKQEALVEAQKQAEILNSRLNRLTDKS